jgi:hypothetical protein
LPAFSSLCADSPQRDASFFTNTGLRVGVDAENRVNLVSYEVFGTVDMDWSWNVSENVQLHVDVETALGGLSGEGKTGVYARIGPVAEFIFGDFPLTLVVSSGPSLYSEDVYDNLDMGGHFQFTSSIGFNWDFDEAWAIGYRFQHTSNASLGDPNPGLDMHTVSMTYTY